MDSVQKLHSVFYEAHKNSIHAELDCIKKMQQKILSKRVMLLLILNNNSDINVLCCKNAQNYRINMVSAKFTAFKFVKTVS